MRASLFFSSPLLVLLAVSCSGDDAGTEDENSGAGGSPTRGTGGSVVEGTGGADGVGGSGGSNVSGGTPGGGGDSAGGATGGGLGTGGDNSSGGGSSGGDTGSGGGGATAPATYCRSFYNSSGGANPCYIGAEGKGYCIQTDGNTVALSEVPGTIVSVTGWDYTTRACAVNDSGAVYCGDYGSLSEWVASGATQVSGLANGPCAIVEGAVQCNSISVPDLVSTASPVTLLGCYSDGCCAATDEPALYCFGDTTENFGVDSAATFEVPLPAGKKVLQIAAGQVHVCVLLEGGQVHCFGQDWNGQLGGLGAEMTAGQTLVTSGATGVAAGQFHTCVSFEDGTVECAGNAGVHGAGQNSMTLAAVPGVSTAIAVTGGRYASCALLADLSIQCWGDYGGAGQGNNETTTPVPITGPAAASCD